ncbi:MAG: biotin/lipoyl-containing protein [Acidobacteriaceae bacterium]
MKLQISVDSKVYEVDVEIPEEGDSRYLGSYIPPYAPTSRVTVPPPAVSISSPSNGGAAGGGSVPDAKVCRSPMAGVVVKLNAQVGQQLQENDLLMVLEAMKMETNITAPMAGKVKAVTVSPGDAVTVDQIVVEFE